MRYSEAISAAPPGAARFQPEDLLRLDRWTLGLLLAPGDGALPAAELRAALSDSDFRALMDRAPDRFRAGLSATQADAIDRDAARRRVVAGAFWILVYSLAPELWDALSKAEPLPPELLGRLPRGDRVLEVAAGSGRLTVALAELGRQVVAVEPCAALRALLRRRCASVSVVAGVGQALPVRDGWADLVVACASFGPEAPLGGPEVLAELERCASRGGSVALLGVESPEWFAARGYRRVAAPSIPDRTMPPELVEFFGPRLQPPRDLMLKVVE